MKTVRRFFGREFRLHMFLLDHEDDSDFYLSCWQKSHSVLPQLCLRIVLFLGCLAILLSSFILTGASELGYALWPIFLTHWGLVLITLTTGFATAVSANAYLNGKNSIDTSFGLPWYFKAYWVLNNITVTIALLITIYYWALLTAIDEDYAINFVMDVFIHAINSVLILALHLTSQVPCRVLHCFHPLLFGIVYILFSLFYYLAGGEGPFGTGYIYPTMDWSKPGETTAMVALTAVGLLLLYFVVVALTLARDRITRPFRSTLNTNAIEYR